MLERVHHQGDHRRIEERFGVFDDPARADVLDEDIGGPVDGADGRGLRSRRLHPLVGEAADRRVRRPARGGHTV
ncbi:MAG: hypothetical protein QOI03_1358, partial [Solirubrobacteraceae bacterium]|nr:hypothetical protein [Solirubrobacteraceae bacterium]